MNDLPKRKHIRIEDYDYSTPGAYFITVCVNDRKPIFWNVGAATCRPNLSKIGSVVETAILQIPEHYPAVSVDKYCVMPDHIHILVDISSKLSLSLFVKQLKQESSFIISQNRLFSNWEGWEEGYAAFSYSAKEIPAVVNYITNQKEHHKKISFIDEYRDWLIEMGVSPDIPYFPK